MDGHDDAVPLGRLLNPRVNVVGDDSAVRVQRVDDAGVRRDGQIGVGKCRTRRKNAGHLDDVDGQIVAVLGDQPHRIAGHGVVHDRGPVAEIVEIVPEEMEIGLGHAVGQVCVVERKNLAVPAPQCPEHVQRDDESVVVVAKIAREVGVEAAFRRGDLIKVPVGRTQRGWAAALGDGDVKSAPVPVRVDILITDNEPPNLVVVDHHRVGQAGAAVGMRQLPGREPEGAERGGRGRGARGLGAVGGEDLIDGLDVIGGPGRAIGVGRNVAAAVIEIEANVALGIIVRRCDGHRRQRPVLQRFEPQPPTVGLAGNALPTPAGSPGLGESPQPTPESDNHHELPTPDYLSMQRWNLTEFSGDRRALPRMLVFTKLTALLT